MTTKVWTPDLLAGPGTKYQAIVDALEAAMADGRLRGGDRLPPQRELAQRLGVDLTTVTRAYDIARQRGLIDARGRQGSFVREPTKTGFAQLPQVDTGMNMPPELPDGAISRAISDGITALLRHGSGARLQYQPPGGALQDRIAGARLLSSLCTETVAEQVVLTAGGQNALHAILATALNPGDVIACGRHVYSGLRALAARLGLRLVPLASMTAEALEDAIVAQGVRALYVVPTNDNPTAHTLSEPDRAAIGAMLIRHDIQLVEDDAYGPLAAAPLPPVTSFAPGQSWYVASTSKIISPALRVAFVRAPGFGAALRLAADVHETAIMAPPINAALVSGWIADGRFEDLIAEMRREIRARRAVADETLPGISFAGHPEGYHLWIPLGSNRTGRDMADALRTTDLPIVPAARFAVANAPDNAIRVSLGGLIDHEGLASALRTLQGHLVAPHHHTTPLV